MFDRTNCQYLASFKLALPFRDVFSPCGYVCLKLRRVPDHSFSNADPFVRPGKCSAYTVHPITSSGSRKTRHAPAEHRKPVSDPLRPFDRALPAIIPRFLTPKHPTH